MSDNNWETLGKNIVDLVENAVDSKEFQRLNQTITSTMVKAAKEVEKGLTKAQENIKQQEEKRKQAIRIENTKLFMKINNQKIKAIVLMAVGYSLAFSFGFTFIPVLFSALFLGGLPTGTLSVVFGILTMISALVGVKGTTLFSKIKRFQTYVRALSGKSYVNIAVLSKAIHKNKEFVVKDIAQMIDDNWFIEGHLDHNDESLMVTDDAYNEYLRTVQLKKEQQEKQDLFEKTTPPEVREVLETGAAYIKEIRRCNDAIPGEEISNKIDKIELVVRKIFKRVEQHPENVNDLRKFMKYYLPTTIKLLRAYEELDQQEVQGENMINSKKEIEKTLDTLNIAFEKLLDDLFQETAWDVSSDISVLESMLAQEGLTKNGL
ncbi:MAG: 5-bromo-4-chloroindolyl phosphate hydrolysis family protein [Bacilli bacterium]|nr:5-bromo-4-chloroindolyl phosphate hydrolysis family protein [Bacilli bacterium]